jgi:hypothetical protein
MQVFSEAGTIASLIEWLASLHKMKIHTTNNQCETLDYDLEFLIIFIRIELRK